MKLPAQTGQPALVLSLDFGPLLGFEHRSGLVETLAELRDRVLYKYAGRQSPRRATCQTKGDGGERRGGARCPLSSRFLPPSTRRSHVAAGKAGNVPLDAGLGLDLGQK